MKRLFAGILWFVTCLLAQTPDLRTSLQTALMALQDSAVDRVAASRQLTDVMMPIAEPGRRPSRALVETFAKELVFALAGKKVTGDQVANLNASIWIVMKGAAPNLKSTGMLRDTLKAAGIRELDIRAITTRFLAIGEDVRGPDDLSVRKSK